MWKYALRISYRGTRFCGWQRQRTAEVPEEPGSPSIQATIEGAIAAMTGEKPALVGSGRTDSGVHASGQVAHFVLKKKEWPTRIIERGLNSHLPLDIRIIRAKAVPIEFHAQRSAEKKQYSYYFQQGPCALPHLEPYSWFIHKRLDLDALNRALSHLIGEHDFKPFQASGAKPGPTVRRIFEAEAHSEPVAFPGGNTAGEASFVRIRLVGSGFLRQMVRGIAGTALQIGERRRDPDCIREILETRNRKLVGPTAPARALWLEQLWYPGIDLHGD